MSGPGPDKSAVQYAASPRAHLWVALCLGMAGAGLGAAGALGLAEVLIATERFVLEALFLAS